MLNFEKNIDKIVGTLYHASKHPELFTDDIGDFIIFNTKDIDKESLKKYLLEEFKEPIKLTQFEFDLLVVCNKFTGNIYFKDDLRLVDMQKHGYYKEILLNTKINEILDNCYVIDRSLEECD